VSPSERERIRAQVRDSRRRQGLPEHVVDTTVLDRLAGRLLADDPMALGTGLPSGRNTDGR
jgi:hypothetical protein